MKSSPPLWSARDASNWIQQTSAVSNWTPFSAEVNHLSASFLATESHGNAVVSDMVRFAKWIQNGSSNHFSSFKVKYISDAAASARSGQREPVKMDCSDFGDYNWPGHLASPLLLTSRLNIGLSAFFYVPYFSLLASSLPIDSENSSSNTSSSWSKSTTSSISEGPRSASAGVRSLSRKNVHPAL